MLLLFSITWGTVSGWWVPVCLLLGILYAWLMYRRPVSIGNNLRYALFGIRALVVTLIALLLVAPLVKTISYSPQKPLIIIAQDNSQSITLFSKAFPSGEGLGGTLSRLKQELGDKYEVQEFNFDGKLHNGLSNKFDGRQTNISSALSQLNDRFVNQNIGALVLATDGLYNQGSDPQYEAKNFKTSIYTIALGDTTPKRDLLIGNVSYNKTAFLGDDFEIEVLAEAYKAEGENMHLNITEDGRQVRAQNVSISSESFQNILPIKLNADKKGIHKFEISILPVKNELSVQNNTETIYVEVLDAKQKILLVYQSPHPDISVIKQAVESNKNYSVKTVLLADLRSLKPDAYSLVILYQVASDANTTLKNLTAGKIPLWYVLGSQSNIQNFDNEQKTVNISASRTDMQEVFAQPAAGFSLFTLSDSTKDKLGRLPPLLAPYGTYGTAGTSSVLLKQRIGDVPTTYPLLVFDDEAGRRSAVLTGEGLWRWRLADFQAHGNNNAVDELLGQSVQYLTANANRQQFRVYPAKNVFDEGEDVLLNAELYNDALELINKPDVNIELKNTQGKKYSFLFSRNGQSYKLDAGTLPMGEYSYTANVKALNRQFTAAGRLTVKALNIETRQSAANHQLLNNIAKQSGGEMLLPSEIGKLADLIRKNDNIKTVVYQDKHYSDIIDVKWLFVVIVALLSTEWFLRKRAGEI